MHTWTLMTLKTSLFMSLLLLGLLFWSLQEILLFCMLRASKKSLNIQYDLSYAAEALGEHPPRAELYLGMEDKEACTCYILHMIEKVKKADSK